MDYNNCEAPYIHNLVLGRDTGFMGIFERFLIVSGYCRYWGYCRMITSITLTLGVGGRYLCRPKRL